MGRLDGKIAIITGAVGSMGAEQVRLFTKEGAKVVAGDLQEETLNKVIDEVKAVGGDAKAVKLDVTSVDDWKNAVKTAVDT